MTRRDKLIEKATEIFKTAILRRGLREMLLEMGEWADENPSKTSTQYVRLRQIQIIANKLEAQLVIAVEDLEYIANSVPGPNQEFELENKNAAQRALDKIRAK